MGDGLIVRGTHNLFVGGTADAGDRWVAEKRRDNYLKPLQFFAPVPEMTLETWNALPADKKTFAGLTSDLPWNVNVLTLETKDDKVLLRLENIGSKDEAEVNLEGLFSTLKVNLATEMGLAGDRAKSEIVPLEWNTGSFKVKSDQNTKTSIEGLVVNLLPMQIVTLLMDVTWN